MPDARCYWILDGMTPRAVGLAEWGAWHSAGGRLTIDLTVLRREGAPRLKVETRFIPRPLETARGRPLLFRTIAWLGPDMSGRPWMAPALGEAKALHWMRVDGAVSEGWAIVPLLIDDARAWGEVRSDGG